MKKQFDSVDEWLESMEVEQTWFETYIEIPFHHMVINPFRDTYYNLKHFPGNLKRWLPFVWTYRKWDSFYTLKALRISLEGQYEQFEYAKTRGWCSVDIDSQMRDIKICINLIKRIEKDNYCLDEYKVFTDKTSKYKRMYQQEKNDVEYLMHKLKDIKSWWD